MFLKSCVPAGTGEKMQYLAHEFNDNTIRFVLRYPGRMDEKLLSQAVRAVVDSVDVLHASFIARHTSAYWRVNDDCREADYFTYIESADPAGAAVEASLQGIALEGKAQLHCTLAQNDKEAALAVRISHLCVDGGDGKYLLEKICEAYRLLLHEGSAAALQVKKRQPRGGADVRASQFPRGAFADEKSHDGREDAVSFLRRGAGRAAAGRLPDLRRRNAGHPPARQGKGRIL